jgi:chromosome partitioning protein
MTAPSSTRAPTVRRAGRHAARRGRRPGPSPLDEFVTPRLTRDKTLQMLRRAPRSGQALIAAVCNQKGGVGKSLVALNLAIMAVAAGYRVLCVDTDPQGSLRNVTAMLRKTGYRGFVLADDAPLEDLARLPHVRHPDGGQFDLIVVDTPGNLTTTDILDTVLRHADVAVIPTDGSGMSIAETVRTGRYAEARGCPPKVLINRIEERYSDEDEARAAVSENGLTLFKARLIDHRAYENALVNGIPITKMTGEYCRRAQADLMRVLIELMGGDATGMTMPGAKR